MKILVGILLLLAVMLLMLLLHQRAVHKKELADVSDMIAKIVDKRELLPLSESEDTLLSKIRYQLMRLNNINESYGAKIKCERDNTQQRITEIAHQLRTPLLNIRTYNSMLRESPLSDEMRTRCVNAIASSEQKLSFLVESFIKMSRFENHLIQIKRSRNELRQTMLDVVTQVYAKATQKKIEISMNQACEIRYPHDPNWLGEAIYNILDNSIKYAPEHSNIVITLEQNEMFTQIAVRDFGKGIEAGEESKIFGRYYRGKNVAGEEGYGIGLYLSREIISQHSGVIKVHREHPGLSTIIYLEGQ